MDKQPTVKKSISPSNNFCPQTLFLYGTYKEDGTPDFGLFCWISYVWNTDLGIMACIGGEKLTKDRIRVTGMFSANLVTEALLPWADHCGNVSGHEADKMRNCPATLQGSVLNVPVLADSPWVFELEVVQSIPLDGSDVFLCRIRNVLADEALADEKMDLDTRMRLAAPVVTTHETYFSLSGKTLGAWGEVRKNLQGK